MKTITAEQVLEKIQNNIQATLKMPKVRELKLMTKPEHFFRQGDLYLSIGKIEDKGALKTSLQLVPGNTIGSRHCIIESPHVQAYESVAKPVLIVIDGNTKIARFPGPLIIAKEAFSIVHPKHGWMTKIQNLILQSWQQCDYTRQRAAKD